MNARDKSGCTALHFAAAYDFLHVRIRFLSSLSLLFSPLTRHPEQGIEILIKHGADAAIRNAAGWLAADWSYSFRIEASFDGSSFFLSYRSFFARIYRLTSFASADPLRKRINHSAELDPPMMRSASAPFERTSPHLSPDTARHRREHSFRRG